MAVSFSDIASKPVADIEAPPLPPVGDYRFRIIKLPEATKSQDGKWEFLRVFSKVVEPLDNVDMADYKGDPANITLSKQFVFNLEDEVEFEKTLFNVKQFFANSVQCVEDGMTMAQVLNASVNGEYIGHVAWRQDKRDESGETFQAEIGKTAPVE